MKLKRIDVTWCPDQIIKVENVKVGDVLPGEWKVIKVKQMKNGKLRVEAEKWYDNDNIYKEPELLKAIYHTQ